MESGASGISTDARSRVSTTAEFYVETLERVFMDPQLARGTLQVRGRRVDCAAMKDIHGAYFCRALRAAYLESRAAF
jgi:hypothetical protein